MNFLGKLEKKWGRYAVKNLSLILIICYVVGYILERVEPATVLYLTLDPYKIIHGQVWRIVSWILIPPPENSFFLAVVMLVFYYSIGTILEHTWGSFMYNLYIFSGMLFTVIGSFLLLLYCQLRVGSGSTVVGSDGLVYMFTLGQVSEMTSLLFSTYYVNMSIFLAFACTFPESTVMFMFIIPVKVKILGFIYGGFLILEIINGMRTYLIGFAYPFVIGSSLLNFVVFFITTRKYLRGRYKKTAAQKAYNAQVKNFERFRQQAENAKNSEITRHKCAVCGRSEKDGDNLVFRFCSKCDGNYEYCQDHLYTHIHFTGR